MKNIILNICKKLEGNSYDDEYFEVVRIEPDRNNDYIVVVRLIDAKSEKQKVVEDESNK